MKGLKQRIEELECYGCWLKEKIIKELDKTIAEIEKLIIVRHGNIDLIKQQNNFAKHIIKLLDSERDKVEG